MAFRKQMRFINCSFFAKLLILKLFLTCVILFACFQIYKRLSHKEYQGYQVIYHTSTSFGEIWVYQDKEERCLSFFHPDVTEKHETCIYREDIRVPVFKYYKMALGALYLNTSPRKILMLGLGGGAMIKFLQILVPEHTQFDIVDINPVMKKVSKDFFFLEETEKINIFIEDAYEYVTRIFKSNNYYDFIIVDVFNTEYIPSQFLSLSFMQLLKGITSPDGGVVSINTFAGKETNHEESQLVFKTFGEFYNLVDANRVIIASNGDLPPLPIIEYNAMKFHQKFNEIRIDKKWLLSKFDVYSKNSVAK